MRFFSNFRIAPQNKYSNDIVFIYAMAVKEKTKFQDVLYSQSSGNSYLISHHLAIPKDLPDLQSNGTGINSVVLLRIQYVFLCIFNNVTVLTRF